MFAVVAAFINVCMMSQTSNCNLKGVTDEYAETNHPNLQLSKQQFGIFSSMFCFSGPITLLFWFTLDGVVSTHSRTPFTAKTKRLKTQCKLSKWQAAKVND